jgi:predicted transcriptional regulator
MTERDLDRVNRAANAAVRSRAELHAAIVAAHENGETYRRIAEAAGLSYQRVAQIVREARAP